MGGLHPASREKNILPANSPHDSTPPHPPPTPPRGSFFSGITVPLSVRNDAQTNADRKSEGGWRAAVVAIRKGRRDASRQRAARPASGCGVFWPRDRMSAPRAKVLLHSLASPTCLAHSKDFFCQQGPAGVQRPKDGFAMPADIGVRRAQPGAAVAYEAAQRSRYPQEAQARLYGCHICGELMPQDWCLTCDRNKTPYRAKYPHLRAPYCDPCKAADMACRVCGTAPSAGPSHMDFAPEGWHEGMGGADMQVAGHA